MEAEYFSASDLEQLTGTKASTWRYWAYLGVGPQSMKLGRRRVWKRSVIEQWLCEQEAVIAVGGGQLLTGIQGEHDGGVGG
ncbi:MAG: helix-turn-helix transcriptional regulator, partial [Mycobacterium sp.]